MRRQNASPFRAALDRVTLSGCLQMFEQSPTFMAMLRSPQHVFEVANGAYLRLVGNRDIVGKTVRDALPDIADQGFFRASRQRSTQAASRSWVLAFRSNDRASTRECGEVAASSISSTSRVIDDGGEVSWAIPPSQGQGDGNLDSYPRRILQLRESEDRLLPSRPSCRRRYFGTSTPRPGVLRLGWRAARSSSACPPEARRIEFTIVFLAWVCTPPTVNSTDAAVQKC